MISILPGEKPWSGFREDASLLALFGRCLPMAEDGAARIHEIDPATARHIAMLARLGIGADEVEAFSRQMTTIIEYFNMLGEVDVTDVPPANLLNVVNDDHRGDEPRPGLDREEFLNGAPARAEGYVKIAPVFGD